jgi:hypothetical protein
LAAQRKYAARRSLPLQDAPRWRVRLAVGGVGIILVAGIVAAVLGVRSNDGLLARIPIEGFSLWPGAVDGGRVLYRIDQPGHLLHIVGVSDEHFTRLSLALVPAGYFAFVAWLLRRGFTPFVIAPLSVLLSLILAGPFPPLRRFPIDVTIDRDRGLYLNADRTIARLDQIIAVWIERNGGGRGGPTYWLDGASRDDGSPVAIEAFDTSEGAHAVRDAIAAETGVAIRPDTTR